MLDHPEELTRAVNSTHLKQDSPSGEINDCETGEVILFDLTQNSQWLSKVHSQWLRTKRHNVAVEANTSCQGLKATFSIQFRNSKRG